MKIVLFHKISCSTSRSALAILEESGLPFTIFEYLKTPLNKKQLIALAKKLKFTPSQMMRTKEEIFSTEYADLNPNDDEACLDAMVAHPILLQRPIVLINTRAYMVRGEEATLKFEKLLKKIK